MIKANELVKLFQKAADEKWGYIWGSAGETWTQKDQDNATREMTVRYGQQWVGKRVADCSGLFVWAFKQLGGKIYHGSNTIWRSYLSDKGTLQKGKRTDGKTLQPGTAVFQMKPDASQDDGEDQSHIGLYIGNGKVIEAWSTQKGVRVTDLVSRDWEQWGELKNVGYVNSDVDDQPETNQAQADIALGQRLLKRTSPNMEGDDIRKLQEELNKFGYSCGNADGIFGSKTEKALKEFQRDNKLKVDGIFGPASLAALNERTKSTDQNGDDISQPESTQTYITVQGDTLWGISKRFLGSGNKYKKIMEANGLKNTIIRPGMNLIIPEK